MKMQSSLLAIAIATSLAACGTATEDASAEASQDAADPIGESSIHQGYSETAPSYEVDGWVISNVDLKANLWNPRGKSEEQILKRAQYLAAAYDLERTPVQQERARQARDKYEDAVAVNSIMIGAVGVVGTEAEHLAKGLKRNHSNGITVTSVTAYAYPSLSLIHI